MTYEVWPGIGLSDEPVEWNKVLGSAENKTKSTANVERRRKDGSDFSTFRSMSKKADASSRRGPPSTMRRGPAPGAGMREDSWGGKIRSALTHGSMSRAEICAATGIKADRIASYLKNDLKQGRILKIVREGELQRFELARDA